MFCLKYIDPITNWLGLEEILGEISIWSIMVRFILAFLCSGLIGMERARRRHAAGFRTYILVCIGSMIAIFTNQYIFEVYGTGDVGRLGAQVISGIGFLGAGTILVTSRSQIKGLTTAAGLWVSACIGLAIGIGFYTVAIIGTIFALIAFVALPKLEKITKNVVHTASTKDGVDKDFTDFIILDAIYREAAKKDSPSPLSILYIHYTPFQTTFQ